MFWSILHRTILWELVRVFLLSLLGITGMLLMAGIVAEASQHGLSPGQILAAIPLLVPSTLPYTLPATTLFATCVVYGRLAHDNEILAIKAAGINILSVVKPALFLGISMTALTVYLYYDLIPSTHYMMRSMVLKDIEEFLYGVLKREHCINYPKLNYRMLVKSVQGRKLIDVHFIRRDPKTQTDDVIAWAAEAELRVDLAHLDAAHKPAPQILVHMKRCNISTVKDGPGGYLEDKIFEVDLPPDFDKSTKKFRSGDMTWVELGEYIDELGKEKEKYEARLALVTSLEKVPGSTMDYTKHVSELRFAIRQKGSEIRSIETEMLMRPALSFGCLCFVLVGCPVGIWFSKSDYLSAFITCFLPIVFVYYPLLLCGANIAKSGKIHPAAAVWCANGIMAVVALPLYRKLVKN